MWCSHSYGAYEMSNDPGFSRNKLTLLNRGFIYAIAHVRGGGDMGRLWYRLYSSNIHVYIYPVSGMSHKSCRRA